MAALNWPDGLKRVGGSRTLTVDHPQTKQALAALDLVGVDVAELRYWSNTLHRTADAWSRGRGFSDRGRISKSDAGRMLKMAKIGGDL